MKGVSVTDYQNEIAKFFSHLRIDYSETQKKQAERLGVNQSYISYLGTDKRPFTYGMYKTICEHYRITDEQKIKMIDWLIKEDVQKRYFERFPDAELKDLFYVMYGEEK